VEADLLKRAAGPLLDALRGLAASPAIPEPLRASLGILVESSGLLAIGGALVLLDLAVRSGWRALPAACGVVAAALGVWLVRHPSQSFDGLFGRWDHLVFAATAGVAITALGGRLRPWWLAAISVTFLLSYAGPLAVVVAGGMTATGMLLLHTPLRSRLGATVAVQATLVAVAYGFAFWLRIFDFAGAARVQGVLAYWVLRHVSLVVSAMRTGPPAAANSGAFVSFYPGALGFLGAPEVYPEFARRNLDRPPRLQHRRAARRIVEGVLLVAAAMLLPVTVEQVAASGGPGEAWALAIALFVRTALVLMGWWRGVDATATLYGVQMRANFAGLLSCRNPTELWWSWRGTLTNWLVQHVYAPLGANRRHQSLNIAAAFAVSFVWHALGVPFVMRDFRLAGLVAVAAWAGVNGAAVIGHIHATRWGLRAPAVIPGWVRTGVATVLTWALGALTPILLAYQGAAAADLLRVLSVLLGLR
jgi:hypothetical protein